MKKRLLTVLLAVCLVLALGTVSALADDTVVTDIDGLKSAVQTSGTITIGADLKLSKDDIVTVPQGVTIVLDMQGHSITVDSNFTGRPIVNNGTLTVTGNGTIDSSNSKWGGYGAINNYGTLTIENGTYIGNINADGAAIYNRAGGELTINDGYFTGTAAINSAGRLTINDGSFCTDSCNQYKDNTGKVHWAYCVISSGELYFYNGSVTGVQGALAINNGYAEVYDGDFQTVGCEHGTKGEYSFYALYIAGEEGEVEAHIYGGTYTAAYRVAVLCGNDNTGGDGGINARATANIHGGTFVGGNNAKSAMSAGTNTGDPTITGGTFTYKDTDGVKYSSDVSKYLADGAALIQNKNTGEVIVDESKTSIARVDGVGYTELAKAIAAADDGDTVTLLEDVNIDSTIFIDKGIEFDLGGKTITVVSSNSWASTGVRNALSFTSGNSVIKNGKILDVRSMDNTTGNWGIAAISGSASLTTESIEMQTYQPSSGAYYNYILRAAATNAGEGTLTLNAGTVLSELPKTSPEAETYGAVAVSVLGKYNNSTVTYIEDGYVGEKLVINEGVIIDTTGFAVTGNGAAHGTTIEINGGVLSSGSLAIYHPQVGNLTVNGGTLTGEFAGIEVRAGNVVINDGTITSTSDTFNCDPNGNGTTTTGAALAIAQHTTKQDISVEINGGTFNGIRAVNEANPQENDPTPNVDISIKDGEYIGEINAVDVDNFISGGNFSDPVSDEYLDNSLTAELYSRSNPDAPYSYYPRVEDALEAAQPGDIVTDLSTVTSNTMYEVTFKYTDADSEVVSVRSGATITLPAPTRNGYTFGGWRYGNTVYKAGETVKVTSDMTFTAVWSAINIPDTYDIEIADTANGEVDTSLSNASAGSTITITATPDSGYSVASVTVTGPDGRIDVVRVNATTYTFKMPAGDVTVRVTFTDSDALPFTDVSAGQWFYDAVAYVYTNGMMEGDSATTFNPDGTMTRAMFWAVLGRIDGATITGTNWADQARDWAMAEGVSDGTDPNGLVTREQMVTMLWRYAVAKGYDVSIGESTNILSYADFGQISEYAIPAMQWGCGSGVITGMTDTTLVPQGTATRAQCAAIFMRFDQM